MKRPFLSTVLVAALLTLLPPLPTDAQSTRKRQPLTLSMFLRPYKPQAVTPQVFGLLPDNKYLQEEIKLTAAQKERMRQIEYQLTRVSTLLLEKEVARELVISDGQRENIRKLLTEAREKSEKAFSELKAKRKQKPKAGEKKLPAAKALAAFRARHEEIEAACDKACLNVLTRTQQARFQRLTGRPIETVRIFNARSFRIPAIRSAQLAHPFVPQTTTPRVFGVLSYSVYTQNELKVTETQKRRMRQIELQLTRVSSILKYDPRIRKKLSLSETQVRRIAEARSRSLKKMRKRMESAKGKSGEFLKKLTEASARGDLGALEKLRRESQADSLKGAAIDKELDTGVLDVLTRAQKQKLEFVKGKPIDPTRLFRGENRAKTN